MNSLFKRDNEGGMAALPPEFFTAQSMLTLTGATGIVFVVTNGLKVAFRISPPWLGLAVAQMVAALGVALSGGGGVDYLVGVINGFLIFSTAAGVSSIGGASDKPAGRWLSGHATTEKPPRRFWAAWF